MVPIGTIHDTLEHVLVGPLLASIQDGPQDHVLKLDRRLSMSPEAAERFTRLRVSRNYRYALMTERASHPPPSRP
jgi:hypothetical protein